MKKRIFNIIFLFLVGIAGGIFANQILLPYLIEDSLLGISSANLAKITSGPVYLTENKKITVQENIALQESISKIENSIVGIRSALGNEIIYGSGIVLTNDGLMVALSDIVPKGGEFIFYANGKAAGYRILKRDEKNKLILIKLEQDNLKSTGFADLSQVKIGERVFLFGVGFDSSGRFNLVNEGILRFIKKDSLGTNIFEEPGLSGSGLFNIKGELLGLNKINKDGRVEAIPVNIIKDFAGF